MPMKLNVGLSRKVGEPNYGSRGASVNLELELDSSLVGEPERLRDRIRQLYQLAKASVDEELNGNGHHPSERGGDGSDGFDRYRVAGNGNGNGHSGNGHGPRRATSSQVKAIHAIAGRNRIDVTRLVQDRFSVQRPDDLSISDASTLIDELKAAQTGASR